MQYRFQQSVRFFPVLVCIAFLACFVLPARTQHITASITGSVRDPQGAVIPRATVTATNVDTQFSRSTTSDSVGAYRIDYLPVGRYTIEVAAAGFQNFVQENVVLSVDQIQMLNISLSVGTQSETVTVTDAPPLVETTSAELGRTVQPEEIIGLPLVNRNAYTEISLTPGVQYNSAGTTTSSTPNFSGAIPSTDVVVNGGIDAGVPMVSYYLDGGLNETSSRNYGNQLPNPDALQEFRVETSNFGAEYGRMSGAVVTAVTRSGTNKFHGSLFEFVRNTALNATPWGATYNAPYHRNQFGGTVGGPVKRDKAFFFFSYAGLRQTTGTLDTGAVVPTALERTGNFSQSKVLPIDPTTGQPYDYNGTPGWIPPSDLDQTAQNLLNKYIPQPNSAGNTWVGYSTTPVDTDEFLGKYDQNVASKDHITVAYFTIKSSQTVQAGGNLVGPAIYAYSRQQNVNISDVHTISARTANQGWLTVTRVMGGRLPVPAVSLGDLGSNFTIQGPPALPEISVAGYFQFGESANGPVTGDDFYAVRDMITSVKGKHTLNYGFEASLDKYPNISDLSNFGVFTFSTATPGSTKNALADFVTGKVGSMEQDTPFEALINDWYYGFFLQDNYKVLPRLTVNMGLRYDLQAPPTESSNYMATFVPGVQSTVIPAAPRGLLFPGDSGVPRGITNMRWHHISPRLGIAWDPFGDGKTAIRAGAGVFYGSVTGNEWNQPANAQPFAVRQLFSSITSLTNVYGNPASFPNGDPFPYHFSPSSPRFLPAAGVEAISENYQWPLTYQINFAIERQLPNKLSVTAAYVGNLMHNLPFTTDANYAAYAPGASTSQASINARRPYDPGVLGQVQFTESNQTGSYHSLQISAHRPLTNNLMLNGFYVLSKSFWSASMTAVGIGGETQDYDALWEERGPSDYDQRNTASISGIWNVSYFNGSNRLVKDLANGWSITPIVTLDSGAPVNILTGSDKNADSYTTDRPNLVAGQTAFLNPKRSRVAAAAEWFNTAAFTANAPGLGIGPGGADGNTPRDYLRAPGYREVDLGIFRSLQFERGIALQVRAEATNAFNLVNLAPPTANLSSSINGRITSAVPGSSREIQLGMRLTF